MTEREDLETPRDEVEAAALALFDEVIGSEAIRLCCRNVKEGDPVGDALLLDSKGYAESDRSKKLRMPFQPSEPEFCALYAQGYRLGHWSTKSEDGRKVVIHFWVDLNSGHIARKKFKRN